MQLKKLILNGFKSFADKTQFDFGEGVTVVVGPNGCGKSNIVDAVRWVLGEQSAKSLRGGHMLDVIFNGTNSRKGMGRAEVTLVFENKTGRLNVDTDEVTVTRRLYRSGDSEYLLNNKATRLKDIRELFMDTGIGADAYSIIEQGKVEVLLQASKQDRRQIFEEAAGISKYKARKREALRKLERTEQNVLRLNDIVAEVEKRLRSIKYQAGKARNYQTYSTRLKELRLNQFLAEYYHLENDLRQGKEQVRRAEDELVALTTAAEQTETRLSLLDDEMHQCETDMHRTENQLLQHTSQISSLEDSIEHGNRRSEDLQETLNKSRKQIKVLREQKQQLQAEQEADQKKIADAQVRLAEQRDELKSLQDVRQEQMLRLSECRSQLDDEKSGLIDIVRRTAQLHNEISSLDIRRNTLSGQKNRLHDRSGQISTELEELLTQRAQWSEKFQEIEKLLRDSQDQLELKRQDQEQLNEEHTACLENLAAAKEFRSGLLSRQQVLSDLEAKLEGVDRGVRQILEAQKADPANFYYIKGMVAQLLQADVKYAAIVEAALKEKSQYLVATSSQAVLEDSENLEHLQGRVGIICLDRLEPFSNGYDFSVHPEVQARLIDLVSFSPDIERLTWQLLGKTILVDTIDSAFRLSQVAPAGYRWVSLEGEVLEADGTLHLGPAGNHVGLISRKSELRQLEVSRTEADERIRGLQNHSEQLATQMNHLEKNLQELRTAIYETNTEKVETRGRLTQIDENINRLKKEEPLISTEIATVQEQIDESLRRQVSSKESLDSLETINQQRQHQIDQLEQQIEKLEDQDAQVMDKITDLKVSLGQGQQLSQALHQKIIDVQRQLEQSIRQLQSLQNELAHAQENLTLTQREILDAEAKISDLFQSRQICQEQSITLREKHTELQEEKEKLTERSRQQFQEKEQLQEQVHQFEMHLNENQLRSENLTQRVQEELELDLAENFKNYQHQQIDWDAVSAEIEELKGKIERLGNINLDAITEQEELEQRAAYLNEQLRDLSRAQRQLEQLIAKINRESEILFRENFEAIRANFGDLFRKLFGGGRAEIVLEDPEDILECGIEIIARPPGKQLQSISLLSGGEKTLTAVALLMAIFKSKPSPFCLLDEVDAALDEANIERFSLVVQEFLSDSQFVIVTHSRRTMSMADVIYGITMQERGVSKKVSVRFAEEEEPAQTGTAVA